MVTNVQDSPSTDRVTIRYLVRCMVEQSGAVRADEIAGRISFDIQTIREELKYWVAKGLVEVLRPVALAVPDEGAEITTGSRGEYYRWIRPSDTDYMWQAALIRHRPLPRLGNSRPIIF
jgi:predicted transcriptional regulator